MFSANRGDGTGGFQVRGIVGNDATAAGVRVRNRGMPMKYYRPSASLRMTLTPLGMAIAESVKYKLSNVVVRG